MATSSFGVIGSTDFTTCKASRTRIQIGQSVTKTKQEPKLATRSIPLYSHLAPKCDPS